MSVQALVLPFMLDLQFAHPPAFGAYMLAPRKEGDHRLHRFQRPILSVPGDLPLLRVHDDQGHALTGCIYENESPYILDRSMLNLPIEVLFGEPYRRWNVLFFIVRIQVMDRLISSPMNRSDVGNWTFVKANVRNWADLTGTRSCSRTYPPESYHKHLVPPIGPSSSGRCCGLCL